MPPQSKKQVPRIKHSCGDGGHLEGRIMNLMGFHQFFVKGEQRIGRRTGQSRRSTVDLSTCDMIWQSDS